jgi:hypothetical protein
MSIVFRWTEMANCDVLAAQCFTISACEDMIVAYRPTTNCTDLSVINANLLSAVDTANEVNRSIVKIAVTMFAVHITTLAYSSFCNLRQRVAMRTTDRFLAAHTPEGMIRA